MSGSFCIGESGRNLLWSDAWCWVVLGAVTHIGVVGIRPNPLGELWIDPSQMSKGASNYMVPNMPRCPVSPW